VGRGEREFNLHVKPEIVTSSDIPRNPHKYADVHADITPFLVLNFALVLLCSAGAPLPIQPRPEYSDGSRRTDPTPIVAQFEEQN